MFHLQNEKHLPSRESGRGWLKVFWLLALIPACYFLVRGSVAYFSEKIVHAGDRLETRICRQCDGKGKDEVYSRDFSGIGYTCPGCVGVGKVEVVLPGPTRPTRIRGAVVAWEKMSGPINADLFKNIQPAFPASLLLSSQEYAITGSVASARVVFEGAGQVFNAKSDSNGRFGSTLPPGSYTVKVEAPGFQAFQDRLIIEPLQSPIWLDKRKVQGLRTLDERRGAEGLAVVLCLDNSSRGGFLRVLLLPE